MPNDNPYPAAGPAPPGRPHKPSARDRGRMRRRLRQQRRIREALLLDLGALVFELQRQGRREPELLQAKAAELNAVDQEVRALADALDSGQTLHELVAAGIAGSCGNCGSLLSTDARYCSACGAAAVPALAAQPAARRGPALDTGAPQGSYDAPSRLQGAAEAPPEAGPLDRIRGRFGRRKIDG